MLLFGRQSKDSWADPAVSGSWKQKVKKREVEKKVPAAST